MDAPLLELRSIHKVYQLGTQEIPALTDVSLIVTAGEMATIEAPSGSGKTSLLNVIGALDRPTSGAVLFRGRPVERLRDKEQALFRRRSIGFVFQAFNLIPTLSAWENVAVPRLLDGGSYVRARRDAVALLERVGLADRVGHRPAELSGGQIQRVAVARALSMDPPLVIADEPTGNLDSHSGHDVVALLREIAADPGRAVIMATHDPRAAQAATRRINLLDGRIQQDAVTEVRP
ncbi:ABC transporter ATP-binding protein [Nocardia sp. NPDC046763]|uniref:ABC transporter ATP-binding protein n=1 Tax=Nocardia sp. NPDC046763 TaxID=3155256 RepID=UPI00340D9001